MRLILALIGLAIAFSPAVAADKTGSSDHSLLTRYPGFEIRDQAVIEYDEADIILGPLVEIDRQKSLELQRLEGSVHNTQYRMNGKSVSLLQLVRNYENALRKLNAEIRFSCLRDDCFQLRSEGSGVFLNNYLNNEGRFLTGIHKRINGETGVLTARFVDGDSTFHITLIISADDNNERRMIHQSIVESASLDIEKIAIGSADEIERLIAASGKAVLDGIYFDHDKARIRAESKQTLAAIAEYLKRRAGERFFVVGHTDGTGGYDYNVSLSRDRANAVIDALRSAGVSANQLRAFGIGPVAPADSNSDESGLANNRRVELVEDISAQ